LGIGDIWNLIILQPIINVCIMLSSFLGNEFGLAIIALTIIVNGITFPLTLRQLHATRKMQETQPKLSELQKKYGKNREKMAQEQMKLYKEAGVSPLGCLVPMLVQMPIWIALYQSISRLLAVSPEDLLSLAQFLYSWPTVYLALPLKSSFLWLNLATRDPYFVMAILVGGTMWLNQKMTTPPQADPAQRSQTQLMMWMMPIMFAFLTIAFPSGLALYWVTSNVFRIVLFYFFGRKGHDSPTISYHKPGKRS